MEKPNAHRALELVVHTIPTFVHALNTSVKFFEGIHQRSKEWLERNVYSTSHISTIGRELTKGWFGCLYDLYN